MQTKPRYCLGIMSVWSNCKGKQGDDNHKVSCSGGPERLWGHVKKNCNCLYMLYILSSVYDLYLQKVIVNARSGVFFLCAHGASVPHSRHDQSKGCLWLFIRFLSSLFIFCAGRYWVSRRCQALCWERGKGLPHPFHKWIKQTISGHGRHYEESKWGGHKWGGWAWEGRERGHFSWGGQGWPSWGGAVQHGLNGQEPVIGRSGAE